MFEGSRDKVTPLRLVENVGGHGPIWIKDESVHRGGTFKDRLAEGSIKEYRTGAVFGSISYGNTARSFTLACREHPSADFVAFVPSGFDLWELGPSTSGRIVRGEEIRSELRALGAHVIEINLGAQYWSDGALAALAKAHGALDGRPFVNVTEGIHRPCYAAIFTEALEQLPEAPRVCICQFGAGILANEGLDVFEKQSTGTAVVAVSTPDPQSIARMLYGPIWVDVQPLESAGVALSRHASPDRTGAERRSYPVYRISEAEVRNGVDVAAVLGLSAEPSGAAPLGFLDRLDDIVEGYRRGVDSVLVINTGNGLDVVDPG